MEKLLVLEIRNPVDVVKLVRLLRNKEFNYIGIFDKQTYCLCTAFECEEPRFNIKKLLEYLKCYSKPITGIVTLKSGDEEIVLIFYSPWRPRIRYFYSSITSGVVEGTKFVVDVKIEGLGIDFVLSQWIVFPIIFIAKGETKGGMTWH